MELIFEAMKLFKDEDYIVFEINDRINADINSGMRLLEDEEMAICLWTTISNYPVEGQLTNKGKGLRDYLKNHEWD
ncbi:hypothetical protein FEM33_05150 [Dyadobacter flavalbus]|uniref:Uncharacterized protein n=1 Tax=Dyadobacter flavalbus TaxID=2579942 RepID=A0A5M8R1T3_9BACT|nr:hypothetical protein [Dyadobacter flavalbus]KAA6440914.1 hypothetical protein FEM33_05150 [Dyadobacter flavalbus]